ncbi:protein of unknown function [Taphrina deformans PYCC 5710]|uniref:Nudix hydrolase domain-containing protein n=1 Tax=Taphrina deformans (strain PYCC 5710 / ATCC 11124 / CBS 356.35 / IMI 108563 / JCM 9778 / NBRC 8474) TaxID=1097556 RepID=R4XE72_TAPDE|nr:protein of unknown function [Taphrina deformans PYCC 5710]|eukprot:CCG83967.1 protein of unknown function [Taphrina deformans PYCC 5710]
MSFNDDLLRVLEIARGREAVSVPSPPDCSKRASVAIIIAFFPVDATFSSPVTVLTDLSAFRRHVGQDPGLVPHVLFIRRATRESDRWSSHIALPGGKREPGETDLEAAVRESGEEVSLDLRTASIGTGSLSGRVVTSRLGTRTLLVLSPFLFLWSAVGAVPRTEGQVSEVSACHWVPLESLLRPENATVESVDVGDRFGMPRLLARGIGSMTFTGITLRPSSSTYSPPLAPAIRGTESRVVWGLTHAVLLDLFALFPDPSSHRLPWSFPTFSAPDVRLILWLLNTRNRAAVRHYTGPDHVGHALVDFYRLIRPAVAITFGVRVLGLLFTLRYLYGRMRRRAS